MACIFCDIIARKAPASILFEDEICLAFMDIRPVNPGHALVIPKMHTALVTELPAEVARHIFGVGRLVNAALRQSGLRCEGVNMLVADGPAAGQEVYHVHLHLLPRFAGDGFGFRRHPGSGAIMPREELEKTAGWIRNAFPGAQD